MTIGIGALMAATAYSVQIPEVPIKLLTPTAKMPQYMTEGAAAMDLWVNTIARCRGLYCESEDLVVAGERREEYFIIGLGFALAIPTGWCALIEPRSSMSTVGVIVHPGLIDSDYRGEIRCVVSTAAHIHSRVIKIGDRIAQMRFCPAPRATLRSVAELPDTPRGTGGFGSTGT